MDAEHIKHARFLINRGLKAVRAARQRGLLMKTMHNEEDGWMVLEVLLDREEQNKDDRESPDVVSNNLHINI